MFAVIAMAAIVIVSCSKDEGFQYDKAMLERVEQIPVGDFRCPYGGEIVLRGIDRNRSGVLDKGEEWDVNYQIFCNDPQIAISSVDGCVVITLWVDTSYPKGQFDVGDIIVAQESVCNGQDGADGADGQDGQDGQDGSDGQDGEDGSSFTAEVITEGDCYTMTIYLDGEFFDSFTVCDGKDGETDSDDEEDDNEEDNKVTVCHNGQSITISQNALQQHLNHGDTVGECED